MKKRIVILVVSLIAITGIIVGVSYAFFSIGGSQEQANTFTSGCLNISLTNESTAINLTNTYPITDIEGLEGESYDFTIKNTCTTETNYSINLESLNKQTNSLSADYIKVALSSDTVDHVISKLSDNTSVTPEIDGSYESYNLYTGTLKGSESKTYHLKLWIDYDATKEEAANKTYSSKINVIANPETTVVDTLEAKFGIEGTTVTSTLTEGVTSASYCTTTDNICEPNTSANISNNSYTVEVESKEENQMVCTKLNNTSKIICSNIIEGVKPILLAEAIKRDNQINSETPDFSQVATTNEGVYKAEDDWGDSYYFRGAITNNWVKFGKYNSGYFCFYGYGDIYKCSNNIYQVQDEAGDNYTSIIEENADMYWRIIRINGDGSIRMIYAGTDPQITTGDSTGIFDNSLELIDVTENDIIYDFTFNSNYNRSEYVGYMYTSGQQHGNTTDSPIKDVVDNWYSGNLAKYADKISTEAGFCGDREMRTGYSWSSTPSSTIYYRPYERLYTNKTPTLKCSNSADLYTVSGSSKGNKALTNPVGLITADEVAMAGGVYESNNSSYYLYTGQNYWTMSPSLFNGSRASVFRVYSSGNFTGNRVDLTGGVRPVINLAHDVVIKSGNGSSSTPYEI